MKIIDPECRRAFNLTVSHLPRRVTIFINYKCSIPCIIYLFICLFSFFLGKYFSIEQYLWYNKGLVSTGIFLQENFGSTKTHREISLVWIVTLLPSGKISSNVLEI